MITGSRTSNGCQHSVLQHSKQQQTSMPDKPADLFRLLMQTLLISLIRGYQFLLSPLLGGQCRFHPSCSHYAVEAIQRHGCCKGLALTGGRILRCNPCCHGGHDPVPDQFTTFKKLMP